MAASQLQASAGALEGHLITQVHRLHDGLQFMKTVGTFAEDAQDEIDLAGRFFLKTHGGSRKQNAPTKIVGARCEKFSRQFSKTEKRLPGMNGAMSPPLKPV